MTYAVIKPDHLGDLILSSAAIRAIGAAHPGTVLFVASKNVTLARYLFPELDIRTIDLAHLSKSGEGSRIPDLTAFDAVAFLRSDGILTEDWAALRSRRFLLPRDTHALHQSVIDYTVASLIAGPYDIDAAFYGDRAERVIAKASVPARRVGLSIGSGFHANTWPVTRWIEATRMLLRRMDGVTILCGPAERDKAGYIYDQLGRPGSLNIVVGGLDIRAFVDAVDDLDLVVASDGGTAHLCSLVTPIVSIFGPSPFLRYAPYGRLNRLLTRNLSCSPCCQYATELVNGCLTTECMTQITARHLEQVLELSPLASAGEQSLNDDVHLYFGVSHIARDRRLNQFNRAARQSILANGIPVPIEGLRDAVHEDLQGRRLALIDALDRLKRASPERYSVSVRRVAQCFVQLREANCEARTLLDRTKDLKK